MNPSNVPMRHDDPWVNLLGAYVTNVVAALAGHGGIIQRSWLDPYDPRDATIVFARRATPPANRYGLVWDEESGWRLGDFAAGEQGRRTVLSNVVYLRGGVLPPATLVADKVVSGETAEYRKYRSFSDHHDGLDDALQAMRPVVL